MLYLVMVFGEIVVFWYGRLLVFRLNGLFWVMLFIVMLL